MIKAQTLINKILIKEFNNQQSLIKNFKVKNQTANQEKKNKVIQ